MVVFNEEQNGFAASAELGDVGLPGLLLRKESAMSTAHDRVEHHRLSRYDRVVFVLLAAVVVIGVTLEISRIASNARKAKRTETAVTEVAISDASSATAAAKDLSTR